MSLEERNFNQSPVDAGRKLNVHKTFRRRPGRLLNVLCTFKLSHCVYWEATNANDFVITKAAKKIKSKYDGKYIVTDFIIIVTIDPCETFFQRSV